MKNKITIALFVLLGAFTNSCTKEEVAHELAADFNVTYKSEFQSAIYPSLIFGLNELEKQSGEPMDYFTITVKPNVKSNIRIVVQESKLNFETVITNYDVIGEKKIIPSLKWKYDELKNLTLPGNVDLTFICYGNDNKEIGRKDLKLSYRAINECVLAANIDNTDIQLYFMVAAYINEDSPVIDAFLKNVLLYTTLQSFSGYQGGDDMVNNQVEACFITLRAMGVKYSSITSTSNSNPNINSQYIRFSDEVLNNNQANCADGTVFFCSVLKKIGIHAVMVFAPSHVYLGYYTDAAKKNLRLLETTMVGNTGSFIDAANYQVNTFNSNLSKINNSDYSDGYFIIDVDNARLSIKPIGR